MRSALISTKPFIFDLFLVGVTVQSAESLSPAIPLGTSTKRANSKRANHGRSRLFQDAVSSVSSWLRSFSVCGWRTRSLSSVSGHSAHWSCVRGWFMRLLWAYEHDIAAISPFLSERIGTLCRHPSWSLWLEQRTTGWRSGRSEGHSKSFSAGLVPTDLLLLTQRASRPAPGWFCWFFPRDGQHIIRCAARRQYVDRSIGGWAYVLWGWRCGGAARLSPPSSLPSTAGLPGGTRAFPRWRERSRCTCARETPPLGGIARVSRPKPVSWRLLSQPKLIVLRARQPLPCMPWRSCRFTKPRHSKKCTTVVPTRGWCRSCARRLTSLYERRKSRRGPSGRRCPLVVQERHLWLDLAEMPGRFLDAPISQAGLFGDTVEGFAQQFSAVQKQTEAIQHILPRRDAPAATAAPRTRPPSARRRGRPPASSRAAPPRAEAAARPARRASRRSATSPASHPGPKSSRKSTKWPWRGQPGDVGVCSFSGDDEDSVAPSPGGGPGGESYVPVYFCSAAGPRVIFKERAISFSSGCSGPRVDSVRRIASSLSPATHFASGQESAVRGRSASLRTSCQSSLGPREFCMDATERAAFCTIQLYSPSLHHRRYVDCTVGATCTASAIRWWTCKHCLRRRQTQPWRCCVP